MLPDPDSLRCFLAAAHTLNFRAAAEQVSLTPAALSKRIQQLERTLGATLFQRTTRRVSLTDAGLALVPRAEQTLDAAAACVRAARGDEGPPPLELTLGTRHELGLSWLLPQLDALEQAFPHVTLHLYFGSGPDLELQVHAGQISCAISSRQTHDPKLETAQLHEEAYALVAKPSLLKKRPLRKATDARQHTLIDAQRSLPLFAYWRDAAPAHHTLDWGQVRILGTIGAIRSWVLQGRGVAVLPRYQVGPDLAKRRLVEVFPKVQPRSDHFRLLFRRDDPRRPLFLALAAELAQAPLR